MGNTIHSAKDALTAPGVVKSVELEVDYFMDSVALRVSFATSAQADAFRDEVFGAMKSGSLKIGPMTLSTPGPFELEEA